MYGMCWTPDCLQHTGRGHWTTGGLVLPGSCISMCKLDSELFASFIWLQNRLVCTGEHRNVKKKDVFFVFSRYVHNEQTV